MGVESYLDQNAPVGCLELLDKLVHDLANVGRGPERYLVDSSPPPWSTGYRLDAISKEARATTLGVAGLREKLAQAVVSGLERVYHQLQVRAPGLLGLSPQPLSQGER